MERFGEELVHFCVSEVNIDERFFRLSFLNYLGAMLSGMHEEAVDILARSCLNNGAGRYSVPGRNGQFSLSDAAEICCFASAVQAYDDIHFASTAHPCGPVASAVLAAAQLRPVSLKESLEALAVGMECECRCAMMMFSDHSGSTSGWYTTGMAGGIGAAAAAGRILGLNRSQMQSALGLAASFASGIRGTHGSMAGSYVPAIASASGVKAALMAKEGFTCGISALCGTNGLIRTVAPHAEEDPYTGNFGRIWYCLDTSCKPYPYGFISFAVIGALEKLSVPERIDEVDIDVSPRCAMLGKGSNPQSMYDVFVSLPYIAAGILLDPSAALKPMHADFTVSEAERMLMQRIRIHEDEALSDNAARVSINHGEVTGSCTQAPGSEGHAMPEEEVCRKFSVICGLKEPDAVIRHILRNDIPDLHDYISGLK
ncbi:MAG: MmgE/PrpD family protein [Solobacterium sp.]|nr:MmgE/PrpD family protein [Solobacterium sp.]